MTFLQRMWAYITLGAMGVVVEEASPIMGGVAAHDRHLRLTMVILAVALGTWVASLLLYLLGRWRGHWLRKRWPRFRTLVGQVRRFEPLIGATLVLLMVIGFVVVQRRHVADRTARVLDPDPGP